MTKRSANSCQSGFKTIQVRRRWRPHAHVANWPLAAEGAWGPRFFLPGIKSCCHLFPFLDSSLEGTDIQSNCMTSVALQLCMYAAPQCGTSFDFMYRKRFNELQRRLREKYNRVR